MRLMLGYALTRFILPREAGKGDRPQGDGRGVGSEVSLCAACPLPPRFAWSPSPLRLRSAGRISAGFISADRRKSRLPHLQPAPPKPHLPPPGELRSPTRIKSGAGSPPHAGEGEGIVTDTAIFLLTSVPISVTCRQSPHRIMRDAFREGAPEGGAGAVPAGGTTHSAPGRSGHRPRRHDDRRARCLA